MWRKIRRFYWYRRDRGLGKQTIAMAVMFLFMVIILAGAIAKSIMAQLSRQKFNIFIMN